jgi:hypothetical protein
MTNHEDYKFSITIHTDDLAVVGCLRALAQYSQKRGNNRIPWGNTKDKDWRGAGNCVTFRFTSPEFRQGFVAEITRLLPDGVWLERGRSDNDPARKPT